MRNSVKLIQTATTTAKSNSQIFAELAKKLGVDISVATRRAAKAASAGIDTRKPDNMEKAIRGDFERLYSVKLPEAKGLKRSADTVDHFCRESARLNNISVDPTEVRPDIQSLLDGSIIDSLAKIFSKEKMFAAAEHITRSRIDI